tara:strand:+ start:817 stop:1029 length:213 start_codon:yes stop_codon:yes gene_type:complete
MQWKEEDIGTIAVHSDSKGTTYDDRIVMVYCQACGARFIGPIREAGGFLGGHDMFHTWEFKMDMDEALEV